MGLSQFEQGAGFDLTNPLSGEFQFFPNLGQGLGSVVLQAKPSSQDSGLSAGEFVQEILQIVVEFVDGQGLLGGGMAVFD